MTQRVISRDDPIPLMRPTLPTAEQVLPRLRAMDESGWYSNFGPQVRELEHRFAALFGVPAETVVTVSSATRGIEGCLATSDTLGWEVPAWTFAATVGAALGAGKRLRFADINPHNWWIDSNAPARLEVAPFGDWNGERATSIDEVVIDAAASLGAMPTLTRIGPRTAVVFSLGATKVLGSGEGGIVVFGDAKRATKLREWTRHGFRNDRIAHTVGSNGKLSEIAAAYMHTALDLWGQEQAEWFDARELARAVESEFQLLPYPAHITHASPYWIVCFADQKTRDRAEQVLTALGIETRRWWGDGCHRMPGFATVEQAATPHTDRAAMVSLGLPMYRGIGRSEMDRIRHALQETHQPAGLL